MSKFSRLSTDIRPAAIPFSEYPRPQLKRDSYICLNGQWDRKIMVPFPLQSELSGFKGDDTTRYTYRRKFEIPEDFIRDKVLLHFGAVDCRAKVYVDGDEVGSHVGGYLPFTIDITRFGAGVHELKVKVKDETSTDYPYGKQTKTPGGMWYTPVSGIWGSVWLESVPKDYIKSLRITPSLTDAKFEIEGGTGRYDVKVYDAEYPADGNLILEKTYESPEFVIDIDDP